MARPSWLSIRRLSARAQRNADDLAVLIDVLLETFPLAFDDAIDNSEQMYKYGYSNQIRPAVWFFPNRMIGRRSADDPVGSGRVYRILFEVLPARSRADLSHFLMVRNSRARQPQRLIQDDVRSAVKVYEPGAGERS